MASKWGGAYQRRGKLSDKSPCPCGGVHVIKFHFYLKELSKMQINSHPTIFNVKVEELESDIQKQDNIC